MRVSGPVAYILLYAAMYAAFGVASPFWPAYFETKGLTSQQIGLTLAVAMVVRLAAGPLIGRFADLSDSLGAVLASCLVMAAATAAAFPLANSFWPLLFIALVQAAALAPTTSLADALSVNAAKPQLAGKPFEYGWIRGSASAAFVAGTLTIGQLIGPGNFTPIIWMNVALLAMAGCATGLLPSVAARSGPLGGTSPDRADMRELVGIARFRALILVSALVLGSHAMHDAFAVIRWSEAGVKAPVISLLWSEAVAAEVVVFFLIGPALIDRLGPRGAATLAAVAGIIRWSVAGVTTSVLLLSIVQPLHGFTFALLHLACMRMLGALVPINLSATAQSLYAFSSGLATAALTLLSGTLYAGYGGLAFFPMAVLCALAVPIAWFGLADQRTGSARAH
jgi:MFS transporter, PPP family, 3-phenylpropionic acid transporter